MCRRRGRGGGGGGAGARARGARRRSRDPRAHLRRRRAPLPRRTADGAERRRRRQAARHHGHARRAPRWRWPTEAWWPAAFVPTRPRGGLILPVDSEHSALFSACRMERYRARGAAADRVGVPFRVSGGPRSRRRHAREALAHPNRSWGPSHHRLGHAHERARADQAHYLFGAIYEHITVVLDPREHVHSMARFSTARSRPSGRPDMHPIGYALAYRSAGAEGAPARPVSTAIALSADTGRSLPALAERPGQGDAGRAWRRRRGPKTVAAHRPRRRQVCGRVLTAGWVPGHRRGRRAKFRPARRPPWRRLTTCRLRRRGRPGEAGGSPRPATASPPRPRGPRLSSP
jgi:hypothetical protein